MSLAIAALGISAGASILGGYLADRSRNESAKAEAKALRTQAGIYGEMSKSQLMAAGMYARQAAASAKVGQGNARNLRLAAANLDQFEQLALRNARLEARQRVGAGRTQFAANGVVVDTGAAALWEQDEAADAALEQLDIMQQFEDQSWQYRTQANKALAEGYAAAAGQAGAAMGAAGEAYASSLQRMASLSAAASAGKSRYYNTIGAALGFIGGAGMSYFAGSVGGASGAAAKT